MKKLIHTQSLLNHPLALLLAIIFLMSPVVLISQNRFMKKFGTSFYDVASFIGGFKEIRITNLSADQIEASNDFLELNYLFIDKKLSSIELSRHFDSQKLANASLEAHIFWLERIGSIVVKTVDEKRETAFQVWAPLTSYHISLKQEGRKDFRLDISAWQVEGTEMPMNSIDIMVAQND